jgi:hypothetical protein
MASSSEARSDLTHSVLGQNLSRDVSMESAEDWYVLWSRTFAGAEKSGAVLRNERLVRILVVLGSVILQNATQVHLVEHDQLIESFAPNRADEELHVDILPR